MYVDEMIDKDGNVLGFDDWPKMVHQHFADLYKALEMEIMAEKRQHENLSHAAMKKRWTSANCRGTR